MPRKLSTPLANAVDKQLYLLGTNRYALAEELDISYQHLSNILTGKTLPTISMSERMGIFLNIKAGRIRELAILRKAI